MRKYILFTFLSFLSFSAFSFAADVQSVQVGFCDGTGVGAPQSVINPGTTQDVCLKMVNNSDASLVVSYEFPSAVFDSVSQMCSVGNGFGDAFFQKRDRKILVKAHSSEKVMEKMSVPVGMSGAQYGCLAYTLEKPASESMGGMFDLVVRKTININFFVGGSSTIKKSVLFSSLTGGVYTTNASFSLSVDSKGVSTLSTLVANESNVTVNLDLSGVLYNFLGFQREFSFGIVKMMPGESKTLTTSLGFLPSYKGLFNLSAEAVATPTFDFNVSGLDKNISDPILVSFVGMFFVFSWIWVIAAVLILALLVKIVLPKKKKIEEVVVSPVA